MTDPATSTAPTEAKAPLSIIIDQDGLRAWVQPEREALRSEMTAQVIQAELETAEVATDEVVMGRINDFLKQVSEEGELPERFLIAEGTVPVAPKDGVFEWAEESQERKSSEQADSQEGRDEGRVDYRERNIIWTVEAETVIGRVIPPAPGIPGADVQGKELRPQGTARPVQLQANVRLGEDGETVWSTAAGRVVYEKGRVRIEDVLEIKGDVAYESGNIDAASAVYIRGTVRDLFKVVSKKSIMVNGAIEAAEVRAAENLVVRGGIVGRGKGKIVVGQEVKAKFCDEADLSAGGEVRIDREIIKSKVSTRGCLFVERGSIIGGQIYAQRGIVVRNLGNESGVATDLRVGLSRKTLWQARQIEQANKKRQEAIEHIRQSVQPLMSNVKRLSPAQKERATELLFQAESVELEVEEARTKLEQMVGESGPPEEVFVLVQGMLYQRVSIAVGDRAAVIKTDIKGPVRIELRKIDNVMEFAAVDQLSGSVLKLPCKRITIEEPDRSAPQGQGGGVESSRRRTGIS